MEKVSLEESRDSETLLENWSGSNSEQDVNLHLREYYQDNKRRTLRYQIALLTTVVLLLITNLVWWWERESYRSTVSAASPRELTYCMWQLKHKMTLNWIRLTFVFVLSSP